ncbi:hypothetical protein F9C07_1955235 [Aspergillus flavus]|uniref:Uncharacterized protein n=1 Tax=Aspergillus flavus (strain ATCC 200026 / FGSC A1120 / IAM 13836 / NRRL 3357 / JCM 12722 / SRRC 167) TaxID=332952 RepID=A0A7U2N029_ASPFN|nr:hypothetical protein F9C07_1955235 [Aspergillus flavus]
MVYPSRVNVGVRRFFEPIVYLKPSRHWGLCVWPSCKQLSTLLTESVIQTFPKRTLRLNLGSSSPFSQIFLKQRSSTMSSPQNGIDYSTDSSVTTEFRRQDNTHQHALEAYKLRDLTSCLERLTRAQLIEVLQAAGNDYVEVRKLVQSKVSEQMDDKTRIYRCEMSDVMSFRGCREAARKAMEEAESRVRFLRLWNSFPDSGNDDFTNMVQLIADHCGAFAHPQTRLNGLTVLCEMCYIFMDVASDDFWEQDRSKYDWDVSIENAMLEIATAMTPAERQAVVDDDDLWSALVYVYQESDEKIFRAFKDVLDEFPKVDTGAEDDGGENDELRSLFEESDQAGEPNEVDMSEAE